MLNSLRIAPDFQLLLVESPKIANNLSDIIESIWGNHANDKKRSFFNGPMFAYQELTKTELKIFLTDYKTFLALQYSPEVKKQLNYHFVAVSGYIFHKSYFLFGRRHPSMNQSAKKWELAPSGGLSSHHDDLSSPLTIEQQIYEELNEELGIPERSILSLEKQFIVIDSETRVSDIVVQIIPHHHLTHEELASHSRSNEYTELRWQNQTELSDIYNNPQSQSQYVDVSLEILKLRSIFQLN